MKTKLLFTLICSTLLLTSCNVENEYHNTAFSKQLVYMYADQEEDSIFFACTDPWKITNYESWLSIDPLELKSLPANAANYVSKLTLKTSANNTEKIRKSTVEIQTFQLTGFYAEQAFWLDIKEPSMTTETDQNEIQKVHFIKYIPALEATSLVVFKVYKDGATLTTDADWITLEETTFEKGQHEVKFKALANPQEIERKANLTLTSNGISTPIEIVQRGKVVE